MPSLSSWGASQAPPPLRQFASLSAAVNLANGFPHSDLFCATRLELETRDGHRVVLGEEELARAQQYAPQTGHEPLRAWVEERTVARLSPASAVRSTMTCGNFDSLARTLDLLLEPGQDALLVDAQAFPHSMGILAPWATARGVTLVEVDVASDGLEAASLRRAVAGVVAGRRAKALLTIPTGQNPTSVDATRESMARVYEAAAEADLWIVEDDPYHFVHFASETPRPSYLACDVDGRVVRLDSFSKWLAPGWRLGWLTAAPHVVAQIAPLLAYPSTVSQALVHGLLAAWGESGLAAHLARLRASYAAKCAVLDAALRESVDREVAVWTPPRSGMFFWLRVVGGPWREVLLASGADGTRRLLDAMRAHGVSAVPGSFFRVDAAPEAALRVSFVATSDEDLRKGAQCLGRLLLSHPPP